VENGYHAGLESRSAAIKSPRAKIQPVTGRFDYNQKLGDLKELLQKGGYRDFSRNLLPLPRLAANPTLTTPGKFPSATAINYSSKLMFAAQELFQVFLALDSTRSTAKPE
jgi:hypothetical protein